MEEVSKSKKMMQHKADNFKQIQEYMSGKSLDHCRMAFRIRCEMVKEIKGNFKDKHRRKGGDQALKCDECEEDVVETQFHCLVCPHWEEIKRGLELDQIDGMVKFFQRLLVERLQGKIGSS